MNNDNEALQNKLPPQNTFVSKASLGEQRYKRSIAIVDVKPSDQTKVALGVYSSEHPPKGFVTHCLTTTGQDALTSEVIVLPTGKSTRFEFTLLLANYGAKKETVEVFEI